MTAFYNPILVDEHHVLIAGDGRLAAAEQLGLQEVPAIILSGLSDAKKRALALLDNKVPANAGWDREKLAIELAVLPDLLIADGLEINSYWVRRGRDRPDHHRFRRGPRGLGRISFPA